MPITTKSAAKARSILLGYLSKTAGKMPTKSEWLTILNSQVNVKEDLQLEQDDIEGLSDALANKLDKNALPNTAKMFEALQESITNLIDQKVSVAAKAAAEATIQLADFDTDDKPVGSICQYVGTDNETKNYFRGYFYEKVREHDAELDNATPTAATVTLNPISIHQTMHYVINGEEYVGAFQQEEDYAVPDTMALLFNNRYIAYGFSNARALDADAFPKHFKISISIDQVFPIAYDKQSKQLVTCEYAKPDPSYTSPVLYINGEEAHLNSSVNRSAEYVWRVSDGKPFILYPTTLSESTDPNDFTSYQYYCLIPRYSDNLIDATADEEQYFCQLSTTENKHGEFDDFAITPEIPIRGAQPTLSNTPWKMMQVSPFCLPE